MSNFCVLPQWLATSLQHRGFESLTPIQAAVVDPASRGRDLRIVSATGSGKTVAVAIALADSVEAMAASKDPRAPKILIVAPTRELASQLQRELTWVFASQRISTALLLGGGSFSEQFRALRAGPCIVVGTPGRLVDHLTRGSLVLSDIEHLVLDEADQLLELGFKDELDALINACPAERRTLLVSATFSGAVGALADAHQREPLLLQGTATSAAHADIDHILHVVRPRDQVAAVVNTLLTHTDGRAIVFVAMRAQASQLAASLQARGFAAGGLSGEMSQSERARTLDSFRAGRLKVLVATDVAARGIDVRDVRTVIHASPPRDAEALIHRSGRTGRAGQSGRSIQLVSPGECEYVDRLLRRSGLQARWEKVPSAEQVQASLDAQFVDDITAASQTSTQCQRTLQLAEALLNKGAPAVEVVAQLVSRLQRSGQRAEPIESLMRPQPVHQPSRKGAPRHPRCGEFATFVVNWGSRGGATVPRLVAMLCRRGQVSRSSIGQIRVGFDKSEFDVALGDAAGFAQAAGRRDPREPKLQILPAPQPAGHGAPAVPHPRNKATQARRSRSQGGFSRPRSKRRGRTGGPKAASGS